MPDGSPELALSGASVVHGSGGGRTWALRDASMRIEAGRLLLLAGPSGSGKTTLLSLLGCLTRPNSGTVYVRGTEVGRLDERRRNLVRQRDIGFIFQTCRLFRTLSAIDNVLLGDEVVSGKRHVQPKAVELLVQLRLERQMRLKPDALSGGEKQRVAIARAIVKDPAIVLADEPTASLDVRNGIEVCKIIRELTERRGKTVVVASHDPRWREFADRVVSLCDGAVVGDEVISR